MASTRCSRSIIHGTSFIACHSRQPMVSVSDRTHRCLGASTLARWALRCKGLDRVSSVTQQPGQTWGPWPHGHQGAPLSGRAARDSSLANCGVACPERPMCPELCLQGGAFQTLPPGEASLPWVGAVPSDGAGAGVHVSGRQAIYLLLKAQGTLHGTIRTLDETPSYGSRSFVCQLL